MSLGVSALTTTAFGVVKSLTAQRAYIRASNTQNTLVSIDATIREVHSISAPPTKFPVEAGINITDDFIVEPLELEMTAIISDDAISPVKSLVTTALSSVLPPAGIIAGAAVVGVASSLFSVLGDSNKPSIVNFKKLLGIIQGKTPIDVFTTLYFYKSMWMSSLKVDRDASLGNALMFQAHFVQIILVQPQLVNVGKYANPGVSAGLSNLGKSGTQLSNIANAGFTNGRVAGVTTGNTGQ